MSLGAFNALSVEIPRRRVVAVGNNGVTVDREDVGGARSEALRMSNEGLSPGVGENGGGKDDPALAIEGITIIDPADPIPEEDNMETSIEGNEVLGTDLVRDLLNREYLGAENRSELHSWDLISSQRLNDHNMNMLIDA